MFHWRIIRANARDSNIKYLRICAKLIIVIMILLNQSNHHHHYRYKVCQKKKIRRNRKLGKCIFELKKFCF